MYNIKVEKDDAEIYLYSRILGSEYGDTLNDVIEKLNAFTGKKITLRINSEGGDIIEAQGMYSYLKNHSAKVHVYIDGLCASAAGIIALAGDKIFMAENALIMIHNPAGAIYGESEDMRKLAEILDKLRDSIAILYEQKTGLSHEQVIEMMKAETWLDAQEAKGLNLIDEITPALKVKNESPDYQAGVKAERERLKALDEISTIETAPRIYQAKYETFQTANDIALDLLRLQQRQNDLVNLQASMKNNEREEVLSAMSEMINRMRGYVTER